MPEPKIIFAPVLDPDVRAIGEGLVPKGFALEWTAHADVPQAIQDADFLCGFIGPLSTETLVSAAANRLKLVQLMSVGYDRFNLDGARAAKLPVSVNGGANAIAVAEHAIMMMLATLKRVHELDIAVRSGGWRSAATGSDRVYELWHSTVGIVGMGRIGQEVATRLAGWESNVIYYDPFRLSADREKALGCATWSLTSCCGRPMS